MPNSIKYNTSSQTLALKKGNFWIGTGDVDKGPTSNTDYWNGIDPPANGYTIYLNKVSNGPSIYVANNDNELIFLTNQIANSNLPVFTSTTECFTYFFNQSDKMVFNINYPTTFTDGLVVNLDAGFLSSYPQSGTTWGDLSGNNNNGTLTNGPSFSSADEGSIVYDGTDDSVIVANSSSIAITGDMTILAWVKVDDFSFTRSIVAKTIANSFPAPFDYYIDTPSGIPNFLRGDGTSIGSHSATNALSSGVWQHVGVTMSGTTCTHYLNGSTNGSGTISVTVANNASFSMYVGNRIDNLTRMKGNYAILQIYNKALSSVEVLQNYNSQKTRFGL